MLKEIRRNAQEVDTAGPSADQPHTRLLAAPRNGRTTPLYGWRQGDIPESALADTVYGITAGHPFCAFSGDGQLHELARDDRFIPSVAVVPYADEDAPPFTAPENGTEGTTCLYQLKFADGAAVPVPLSRESSLTVKDSFTTTASPTACEEFSESF